MGGRVLLGEDADRAAADRADPDGPRRIVAETGGHFGSAGPTNR